MPIVTEREAYIKRTSLLTPKETVKRGELEGFCFSEHALRQWLKSGAIPSRQVGTAKKNLIFWPNVVKFLTCADGADNTPPATVAASGVRRID